MVIWIAAGALGLLGIVFTFTGLRGSGRRPVSGGFGAIVGLVLLGAGGIAALLGVNLRTYERLTTEQMAARLDFVQQGPQAYQATLTLPDGEVKEFELSGDDWQLDARVIKFPGWANVAGLDAVYRLDRIAGRYHDVNQEMNGVRTVYAVFDDPGIDVWKLAREQGRSLQIDASFGSGVYHPMADGASYEISMTQSSLVSRPANPAATEAVGRWDGRNPPPPIPENLIVQN
jgi:hypothetical protein